MAAHPSPEPRAPRLSAEERRADVLRAAIVEFAAGGLAGTSTEAIAARAGVSQPYLFRLFGTKKALFLAAVEATNDRTGETFRAAHDRAAATGADPFLEMGIAYIELLGDRDHLLLQQHAFAACGDPEVREVVRRRFGGLWEWLRTLPGGTAQRVQQFVATGMLLNVVAAQDLMDLAATESWAAECLDAPGGVLGHLAEDAGDCPPPAWQPEVH